MTKRTARKASKAAKAASPKPRRRPAVKKAVAQHTAEPPTAGDQIRRAYKGRELVIDVVDGQFIYEGKTFASLSALAKHVVGYGISGPHFFRMAMPKPGKLTGGE